MPNWCENHLGITGKEEDMKPFMEKITENLPNGEYSLLEKLYPTPEELNIEKGGFTQDQWDEQQHSNFVKHGYADWYDWRIAKWGTKWSEHDIRVEQQYTVNQHTNLATIAFGFDTAWAPPIEAFDKIAGDYPNLVFTLYYEEPGMGFCGSDVWADGDHKESDQAELVQRFFDEDYLYSEYIKNNMEG